MAARSGSRREPLVDLEVFQRRLAKLEELLCDLRAIAVTPREQYLSDRGLQAQTERWLHLAAECMLDLAHHLIAERGWRTPSSNRDSLRVLTDNGVLDPALAADLEGWAGLRNVLVHLYLDVDHETVFEIVQTDLDQLERFAQAVARASTA
jgi:uncharacterized protein YutE (UPF0331/DUF86 family)